MKPSRGPKADPAEILASYLGLIDSAARSAGKRAKLTEDEISDLVGEVRLHFVENDYNVIKIWGQRSSLKTYLSCAALRFAKDTIRKLGRYMLPAEALLRGPMAVLMNQLVQADGYSPAEAAKFIRRQFASQETDDELIAMVAEVVSESSMSAKDGSEAEMISRLDQSTRNHEMYLSEALSSLPADDQMIIIWRFWDGLMTSEIANRLDVDRRSLYARMETLLVKLRRKLLDSGVDADDAMALLPWSKGSLDQLAGDKEPSLEVVRLAEELSVAIIHRFRSNPESLHGLHPRQFEELVAELLASYGWRIELTPTTRDGGYDLFAISRDDAGVETSLIVECKRYRQDRPVGIEVVRALYGVKHDLGAANVLLATTSRFSRDVYAFKASRYDLELRDYEGIVEWINRYRPHPNGHLYVRDHRLVVPEGLRDWPPQRRSTKRAPTGPRIK